MTLLAARELAFFVHVLGAMLLVGSLVAALAFGLNAWRKEDVAAAAHQARLAFRTLLLVAIPSWIVMRLASGWVLGESGFSEDATWIRIGYGTAEGGGAVLLVATILAGVNARMLRKGRGGTLGRVATVLLALVVLAYVVAVWAMSAKPD